MDESLDSNFEQGSTLKYKDNSNGEHNEYSCSKFVSQSEEVSEEPQSELDQSASDKKSSVQERKRILKAQGKSEDKQSEDTLSLDKSHSKTKESSSKRKKKTEQYKNQVIVDQYGVFEFDKDPEGYKRARKRQQNRESALRARDKRTHKMETVE